MLIALVAGLVITSTPVPASAGTDTTCFRVLHASPDGPPIDIYVSNTKVGSNLSYTNFGTRTWRFARGDVRVRVYTAGSDPLSVAYRDVVLQLEYGKCYVIIAGNFWQQLEIFSIEDPPVPPTGQFTVRMAHLAPGVGALDLVQTIDGSPWIGGVVFKAAATTTRGAGSYGLQVKASGGGPVLIDLGTLTFRSRERQTIYIFAASAAARAANANAPATFKVERDR
jgi:hypothetical protein